MRMFNGKVYGVKVSDYGVEHGYLDYKALSEIVGDCILNNTIRSETMEDWELVHGEFGEYDQIYQDYIVSDYGYKFLEEHTDEIVFHNEKLDLYIWGVTHFGTSWDYVLTDIEVEEMSHNG